MRVSICQMMAGPDKQANIATAISLLEEAARQGGQVAVLPECMDYMGPEEGVFANAEEIGGPFCQALAATAAALNLWIVGGTIRIRDAGNRVSNTLIVYGPTGRREATYRKLHTFDVSLPGEFEFIESRTVRPGDEIVVAEVNGVSSGLSICYDLRFPELFRLQALAGAKILYLPSAFTMATGRDHWEVLLRARAIENQCYVIASNQYGAALPTIPLYGRSMIVDPWGIVIACIAEGQGVMTAEVDVGRVDEQRRKLPAISNRRTDIYDLSLSPSAAAAQ